MVASPVLSTTRRPRLPRTAKAADATKQPVKKAASAAEKAKAKAKEAPVEKTAAPRKAAVKSADKSAPAKAAASKSAAKAPTDKFLQEQLVLLEEERATYEEQAAVLKAQADQMALEMEPGDIQFDDESGEGGTANIDRERDLALSAQARLAVDEIDHAMAKIANGTYGRCEGCGQLIPKARLKALPQARLCVACKSGGLSRR
jgi:DnaK suppressor protein